MDNFSSILKHFQAKFSENKLEAEVSTWLYSYVIFFSSSKKRFVKARTVAATCYFMIRKLIKFDAETSGRSNREYMYLDQLLTAKHFQAMAIFLDSPHEYMLLVCDDVKINSGQEFEMSVLGQILNSTSHDTG
jgi:hypothetical protein